MIPVLMLLIMTKPDAEQMKQLIDVAVSHAEPPKERKAAIAKLGQLGDPAAVVPLTMLLDGNEGSEQLAKDVRAALTKLDAASVLLSKLASPADDEKLLALDLLALLAHERTVDPVGAELASKNAEVREKAAAALGRLGDRRAVAWLVRSLADAAVDVRMAAAFSLGALGGPEATRALEDASKKEPDAFVKVSLESALAQARAH